LVLSVAENPFAMSEMLHWLLGSVANRSHWDVAMMLPFAALGMAIMWRARAFLNALSLGEDVAESLGFPVQRERWLLVLAVAMAVGAAVAVSGNIGFVGLVVPHMLRPWLGHRPGALLLPSALAGALLLLWADLVVQQVSGQVELKLGVVTALLGITFATSRLSEAQLDRDGEKRAAESAMYTAINRIARDESTLHAWASLADPSDLSGDPTVDGGLLAGVGIGIKDIIDTADLATERGSPLFAGRRPALDATVVARLRAHGAVVVGKTVTTEYAFARPGPTCGSGSSSTFPFRRSSCSPSCPGGSGSWRGSWGPTSSASRPRRGPKTSSASSIATRPIAASAR
jgi:hypothetical protein